MLLAYEKGTIPPNLHFQEPNPQSAGLSEGRLKVHPKHPH